MASIIHIICPLETLSPTLTNGGSSGLEEA